MLDIESNVSDQKQERLSLLITCLFIAIVGYLSLQVVSFLGEDPSVVFSIGPQSKISKMLRLETAADLVALGAKFRELKQGLEQYIAVLVFGLLLGAYSSASVVRYIRRLAQSKITPNIIVLFSVIFPALVAYYTLDRFPNSGDEYAVVFQAQTYAKGEIWETPVAHQKLFETVYIVHKDGKLIGQYTPGWPAMLAIAHKIGIPMWLVSPFFGGLSLAILIALGKKLYDDEVAVTAALIALFSSFYLFNSASFFSHAFTSALVLLFWYFAVSAVRDRRKYLTLVAGALLGCAFITRPFTAIVVLLSFLFYFAFTDERKHVLKYGLLFIVGFVPFVILLLIYNYLVTGDPMLMVGKWYRPDEGIGFVMGHNASRAVYFFFRHIFDLVIWSSPALVILAFVKINTKQYIKRLSESGGLVFLLLLITYILYHSLGGNRYGPRYLYEGYLLLILFVTVNVLRGEYSEKSERFVQFAMVSGLYISLLLIPIHVQQEQKVVDQRQDLYDLISADGISDAVVFVGSSTSPLRPMSPNNLIRNSVTLDDSVLYTYDYKDESKIAELKKLYPSRTFYRYSRNGHHEKGYIELIK